jgi:asparagine synthase (glutamine-hydrolysing)
MCGIVGIINRSLPVNHGNLSLMAESLAHRGPDAFGEWISADGKVGFGHRRLSILDLSPAANQPMHMPLNGLTIVFNGEIYNFIELRNELNNKGYIFDSRSDTEVLLAAYAEWGKDCLSRINGMFAFAIYDARNQSVFLARDRAGEKPLFYKIDGDSLYFSSELKGILAIPGSPRQINQVGLECYLAMGFVPGDLCILKGYNKLPPAHAMQFFLGSSNCHIWKYWELPSYSSCSINSIDEEILLLELENLLEDSVSRQLVADVPVGILLSGGVDSSLVTAMAIRHSKKVNTFSIGFPGYGNLDETEYAKFIAQSFGTNHTVLSADPSSAYLLPLLAKQFDEPIIDSSMIPTFLVSQLVKGHCKVALGGDGGDELFGGYQHYSRLLKMENFLRGFPTQLTNIISSTIPKYLPMGFKGKQWLASIGTDFTNALPMVASYFDENQRNQLIKNYFDSDVISNLYTQRTPLTKDLLQRATRMDFYNYLPEDILVKVDRASMLNSLEIRSPFLDRTLIEFAFSKVPSHLKATPSEKKILLKRLASKVLPPEFDLKRKQGFSLPMKSWLKKGPFRDLIWETLRSNDCIFDSKAIDQILSGQDRGFNNEERLFGLVQFELWRKSYGIFL